MLRRNLMVAGSGLAVSTLAAPAMAQPAAQRVIRYSPHANLPNIDPFTNTAFVARDHAFLVFDQLYGMNERFEPQPQMVAGHVVENDGLLWRFTLRDGLKFHDGTPVRGRDCVASIRRWGRRDAFGQVLLARVAEMVEVSDKVFEIKLNRAFPKMLEAFSKVTTSCLFIMPERLANVDPFTNITEAVGSGPFRFLRDQWVPGSRVVYERNADYVPLPNGTPSMTSGPKVVHFDRVEWNIMPDPATASAAIQSGELDWWEQPTADLFPLLARNRNITVDVINNTGLIGIFRPNHLVAPFNNPAVRRAVITAINQMDFMTAVIGTAGVTGYPDLRRENIGFFAPDSPSGSTVRIRLNPSMPVSSAKSTNWRATSEADPMRKAPEVGACGWKAVRSLMRILRPLVRIVTRSRKDWFASVFIYSMGSSGSYFEKSTPASAEKTERLPATSRWPRISSYFSCASLVVFPVMIVAATITATSSPLRPLACAWRRISAT